MKSNEIESKEQRERDINSKVKELRAAVDKTEKRVSLTPDHKELALAKLDKAIGAIHKKFFDPEFGWLYIIVGSDELLVRKFRSLLLYFANI